MRCRSWGHLAALPERVVCQREEGHTGIHTASIGEYAMWWDSEHQASMKVR